MLIIAESIFWTSLGIFLLRGNFITLKTPKLLGLLLYWIGIPLQILALAQRSNFQGAALLPPSTAIIVLLVRMVVASICSLTFFNNFEDRWQDRRLLDYDAETGGKQVDRQSRPITP
ncbi:hypothetical protein [Myxosarcina sp. GI1(2024)]